jgi:lipoprotein-anchoring transpeptidase ErfK/SrfK
MKRVKVSIKKHLSKRMALASAGVLAVAVLSLGTVAALGHSGQAAKPMAAKELTLVDNGKKITVTPSELGWSSGQTNQAALTKKVTAIAAGTQQAPVDAKIITQNGSYSISPSVAGQKVDVSKAVKMIKSGLFAGTATIKLPMVTVAPSVTETSLQPQLQQLNAQHAAQVAAAQTAAAAKAAGATSCAQNPAGRQLVIVSISQQHLWACSGTSQVYDTAITSGAYLVAGDATPTGTWHIYAKETNQVLKGCDANGCWNDPVNYWMPFYSDYGFHDAPWQTFAYGSAQYASDGSHGCVHLPAAAMAWLYGWAAVGTTVTVNS